MARKSTLWRFHLPFQVFRQVAHHVLDLVVAAALTMPAGDLDQLCGLHPTHLLEVGFGDPRQVPVDRLPCKTDEPRDPSEVSLALRAEVAKHSSVMPGKGTAARPGLASRFD